MPITPLPPVPDRSNPGTFANTADAFFAAFPTLIAELNANPSYVSLPRVDLTGVSAVDFTGLPDSVYEMAVLLDEVLPTGAEQLLVQVSTSSGLITTGYTSRPIHVTAGTAAATSTTTTGANLFGASGSKLSGVMMLRQQDNKCFIECVGALIGSPDYTVITGCVVNIPSPVTAIRVTRLGASNFVSGFASMGILK